MVNTDNKIFDKVYNKVIEKLESKVKYYTIKKKYGSTINYKEIRMLNMIIKYLDNIKKSTYNYYYIDSLTEISNYLNKI